MTRPLTAPAVCADAVPAGVVPAGRCLSFGTSDARPAPRAAGARRPRRWQALSPLQLRRNRSRGIPRRTAVHWRALARLVEPLDAARAALHHGDDVRYRRAGAHAAAVILQRCAASGRAWWGWTAWDWATVCGPSSPGVPRGPAAADRHHGAPVHDRAGLSARRVQRLPAPGQLQPSAAGPTGLRRRADRGGDEPGGRGDGPLGLPQPDPRGWSLPAARHPGPGPADQPQPPAGGPDHRGVRRAARPPRQLRPPPGRAARAAAGRRRPGPLRPARPARLQPRPRYRRHPPGLGRLGAALARHLHSHPQGPRPGPDPDGQGRAVAGRRAPRDHRTRPVDPVDLRGLGRRDRPDDRRRLHPAPRSPRPAAPGPRSPRAPRPTSSRPAARSSATARNGNGSAAASTPPGHWPCRAASPR